MLSLDAADAAGAPETALAAVRLAAPFHFHRCLMSFPALAARTAAIGLPARVETEFLTHAGRERRPVPADAGRDHGPEALALLGRALATEPGNAALQAALHG